MRSPFVHTKVSKGENYKVSSYSSKVNHDFQMQNYNGSSQCPYGGIKVSKCKSRCPHGMKYFLYFKSKSYKRLYSSLVWSDTFERTSWNNKGVNIVFYGVNSPDFFSCLCRKLKVINDKTSNV